MELQAFNLYKNSGLKTFILLKQSSVLTFKIVCTIFGGMYCYSMNGFSFVSQKENKKIFCTQWLIYGMELVVKV